ncbi:tumor necrosis factor receptor superfamily member 6B-like isoform X1 [Phycodurus eques]|uniref:tumor necrosis factor receptor superfamily member 6B-like isoform X1 n=1 Tax=Phycodurus eques TaxID=693459 RepID=UPI002ACD8366|nr:tumor necrosis factor receptor superfamily member 6B-like isoform X1 [Phycodurus eques]
MHDKAASLCTCDPLNIGMLTLSPSSLLPLLLPLLCGVHCHDSASESPPTYKYKDPSTGETLACDKCPPGTHMSAHCTAAARTRCAPCRENHFTELWNYLPKCLYCSNFCTGDKEVETQCGPRRNRACRCKLGYFMTEDDCSRHSECARGHGVLATGTSQNDTVCQKCPDGSFSSSSSAVEACARRKTCVGGQLALLDGSAARDTVCGLCEDLANGGELLRTFLSSFFTLHRMRFMKMKRLVHRYMGKSGKERRTVRYVSAPHEQRRHLSDRIGTWLREAPKEQLEKLPRMLRLSRMASMAEKLDRRLKEIEGQTPNCTLTHLFSFD